MTSRSKLFSTRSPAVAALASAQAGCVEVIAGGFRSQGQKISKSRIHLQNLRGHPDGSSWLVKIRADIDSVENSFMDFSQGQNCWRYLALILSSPSAKKETEVKLGRPL